MQPADHPAGDDRHAKAKAEIGERDLPAEHRKEEPQRDFIDHRCGDQEREGHAERHAGGDKADEERNGRAGAERREDAQTRSCNIPKPLRISLFIFLAFFWIAPFYGFFHAPWFLAQTSRHHVPIGHWSNH